MIPYGRQSISDDDIAAVVAILKSDWLTQGPQVPAFEQALVNRCGSSHAVAVSSGTAALHLACLALGLGPGDWLWTTANTFVASANCGRYCGADVDFVDIDPVTWNMDVQALEEKLRVAARSNTLPKIVVPVHFAGLPCDMDEISRLSREYGFAVIEDAAHALGARYKGQPVGSGDHSDLIEFSFHPVKHITTGEGGALLTRRADLAERLRLLRSHGITRVAEDFEYEAEGGWYYEQQELGFHYRLTDIQAALGASQLARLDDFLARRRAIADRYDRLLADVPVGIPGRCADRESAWHLYMIQVDEARCGRSRASVFARMRAEGIGVNVHYIPVHLQPYYRKLGFKPGDFPRAENYYRCAISLPIHARLTDEDQERVVAVLKQALEQSA